MTDNFDLITNFIQKEIALEKGDFFFVQILQRRKENPGMKKDVSLIKNFFFYSIEEFYNAKDNIIELCHEFNARAYIRLNKRNIKKISLQTLKIVADDIINGTFRNELITVNNEEPHKSLELIQIITGEIMDNNFSSVRFAYLSACGQFASDPNKKWIIDLDDSSILEEVSNFITTFTPILITIPTKNGYHIITSGFNPNLFKNKYPTIEIQKDSPTVLYCI